MRKIIHLFTILLFLMGAAAFSEPGDERPVKRVLMFVCLFDGLCYKS